MNQPDNFPELSIGQHAPDQEPRIRTLELRDIGSAGLASARHAHEAAIHDALAIEHME